MFEVKRGKEQFEFNIILLYNEIVNLPFKENFTLIV